MQVGAFLLHDVVRQNAIFAKLSAAVLARIVLVLKVRRSSGRHEIEHILLPFRPKRTVAARGLERKRRGLHRPCRPISQRASMPSENGPTARRHTAMGGRWIRKVHLGRNDVYDTV